MKNLQAYSRSILKVWITICRLPELNFKRIILVGSVSLPLISCVQAKKHFQVNTLIDRQVSSADHSGVNSREKWSAYKSYWYGKNAKLDLLTKERIKPDLYSGIYGSDRNFYDLQKISFQSQLAIPKSRSSNILNGSVYGFTKDPITLFEIQNRQRFSTASSRQTQNVVPAPTLDKTDIPFAQVVDIVGMENQWLFSWLGDQRQDQDTWFRIFVPGKGSILNVDARFQVYYGDLNLEIYDSEGHKITESKQSADDENLTTKLDSEGIYYIRVVGNNQGNLFDLKWSIQQVWQGDDLYEDNDFSGKAFDLTTYPSTWLSYVGGLAVNLDNDFYRIKISKEQVLSILSVDLRFDSKQGDLDLLIYDSAGQLVASSTSTTDDEFVSFQIKKPGDYYLKVSAFSLAKLQSQGKSTQSVIMNPVWYDLKWSSSITLAGQQRSLPILALKELDSDPQQCPRQLQLVTTDSERVKLSLPSGKSRIKMFQSGVSPILVKVSLPSADPSQFVKHIVLVEQVALEVASDPVVIQLSWQNDGVPRLLQISCESSRLDESSAN